MGALGTRRLIKWLTCVNKITGNTVKVPTTTLIWGKMKKILIALLATTGLLSSPSFAHGGGNWGAALLGGAMVGTVIAANSYYRPYAPYGYGYGSYGYSYGPYYPSAYVQPQAIYIQQQPQVFVTQPNPKVRPLTYFCPPSNAFYPVAQSCPTGWIVQ